MLRKFKIPKYFFTYQLTNTNQNQGEVIRTKIKSLKDRYSIHKLTDTQYLRYLVRSNKYQLRLNQKIILLYRLNQVYQILNKKKQYCLQFTILVRKIQSDLLQPDDYACLGTYILTLVRLQVYDQATWYQIIDWIRQHKYDDQYDEIYALIIAFEFVRQKVQNEWIVERVVQIYRQFLQVLMLHIRQKKYNLKEMKKICHCLYKYKINENYFWQQVLLWFRTEIQKLNTTPLENFFIVHQSQIQKTMFDDKIRPQAILEQITEIAFILTENSFPVPQFIQFTENLISFSLINQKSMKIKHREIEKKQLEEKIRKQKQKQKQKQRQKQSSKVKQQQKIKPEEKDFKQPQYKTIYINPIQLYNESIIQYLFAIRKTMIAKRQLKLLPNIITWIRNLITRSYMKYTIHQIMILNESRQFLGLDQKQMHEFILLKIKMLRQLDVSVDDLKNIFEILDKLQLDIVEEITIRFLHKSHPSVVLSFTKFMEQYLPYMPNYFVQLPTKVNQCHKYYSFDENCYFYYTLLTNEVYWKSYQTLTYDGQMQKLKQTIKISAFSRGFKMNIDSHFYKLLNYIDITQFFDGGNV